MKALKDRIIKDGKCFPGGILKVDSFINHQMDASLMRSMAVEFVRRFASARINKIITVEASGIAPAIMVGNLLELPVVFAKKKKPSTMENMLCTTIHSFTKDKDYTVCVSGEYLGPDDRVLFIDDFLANGNAALGILDLVKQAGATLEGMGFLIEKFSQEIDRKASLVIAISLALGIGVEMVPDILCRMPQTIREIFSSGITTGSCAAIITNLLIRHKKDDSQA